TSALLEIAGVEPPLCELRPEIRFVWVGIGPAPLAKESAQFDLRLGIALVGGAPECRERCLVVGRCASSDVHVTELNAAGGFFCEPAIRRERALPVLVDADAARVGIAEKPRGQRRARLGALPPANRGRPALLDAASGGIEETERRHRDWIVAPRALIE